MNFLEIIYSSGGLLNTFRAFSSDRYVSEPLSVFTVEWFEDCVKKHFLQENNDSCLIMWENSLES